MSNLNLAKEINNIEELIVSRKNIVEELSSKVNAFYVFAEENDSKEEVEETGIALYTNVSDFYQMSMGVYRKFQKVFHKNLFKRKVKMENVTSALVKKELAVMRLVDDIMANADELNKTLEKEGIEPSLSRVFSNLEIEYLRKANILFANLEESFSQMRKWLENIDSYIQIED